MPAVLSLFVLVLCVSWSSSAAAQDPAPLSVEDALTQALNNNPEIRGAQIAVRRAKTLADGELSLLTPVLSFETSYLHSDQPTSGLYVTGLLISDVVQYQLQASKSFETGTLLSLQLQGRRQHSFQPFIFPGAPERQINEVGPEWDETLSLTLSSLSQTVVK